jgi:hypothetical protein
MNIHRNLPIKIAQIALLLCVLSFDITPAQSIKKKLFVVDTLLTVNYDDSIYKISAFGYPELFCATSEFIYFYLLDGNILIFDIRGEFITKKNINKKPCDIACLSPNKTGLIIVGFHKIYYLNNDLIMIDSIENDPRCAIGQQFNIFRNIYFMSWRCRELNSIVRFDIDHRSFSCIKLASVWKITSPSCVQNPFSGNNHAYTFSGASKKIIITSKGLGEDRLYRMLDLEKCSSTDMIGFNYDVNPTVSPYNTFQFINDTTAIFNVRYFGHVPAAQQNSARQIGPKAYYFVFYRITFNEN